MKTNETKAAKKLTLKKETLRTLSATELSLVKGAGMDKTSDTSIGQGGGGIRGGG